MLEASTPAGKTYKAVIFGAILLSVLALLQVVLGHSIFVSESARPDSQFQTAASGVYWAIVTMTTVGYGEVVPQTELGQLLASTMMLLRFGTIAISTGILTVSGVRHHQQQSAELVCSSCGRQGHRRDARHCDACDASLPSRA